MKDNAESRLRTHVTSVKEDLMTGVSFMIPFVTIGGIFLALGFMIAELPFTAGDTETVFEETGSLAWYMAEIGVLGLTIMIPILGAYIAYAIADKPGLAPGFILSYAIQQEQIIEAAGQIVGFQADGAVAGFLGAIVAGLLAGYVARWMKNWSVPSFIKPMMPVLVIPVVTTALLAPLVILGLGVPIAILDDALTTMLEGMEGSNAILLGLVLGAMMAFDMGGPVNKVAYVFGVALIGEGIYEPMAAIMIAGMVPPLGLALSNFIAPHKYSEEMYENAKAAVPLGLSFITEGAIPYAAADPLRVIPSIMAGSATAAATALWLGVTMPAPHGGIFVVILSNQALLFLACLALGTLVTATIVTLLKPDYEDAAVTTDTDTETTQPTD
ncbi:PTS system D-fructose-specific IIB component (F1P-forming), Frc family /PTS system D-fructose-specific IIC component (F1P-forming), Frc family [Halobiforma haloterrestris]|uniref:PTS system D-fructose-specific IIB component (F1P-forming), Frc family /PTS system D-fructose-specific IIC component (F1P-forming), Frc family n=1 Tax=Natronobacterium haloterrestre TaxID=148448 RepID=A0A1I1ESA1_NATHA|nr:PTS fructose transporter subunit IIC [Halobiforma haloterrestris]SFB87783.1 PTS system D-fructose-specific IIB component (F1P-forming), Frc family /PTS system D-fructose-specific IIC component (F1P-forming), Frc family [Halobiforma haloterrestris]